MSSVRIVFAAVGFLVLLVPGPSRGQAVGFAPQFGSAPDGVFLPVTPVATYDRRYVRISASPLFTNITDVFTFTTTGAITGGGNF